MIDNKHLYFSNLSQPNPHEVAAAILTIRNVCKIQNGKCEGCPLSIFDPSDKTYECGVTYNDPMGWDISAPPAKPWKAFKQIGE